MPAGSSPKRERQYEHIKESSKKRGASEERSEEIAARTVNKQRAQSGEAKSSGGSSRSGKSSQSNKSSRSSQSSKDTSSSSGAKRGGRQSGGGGSKEATYDQLYEEAKRKGVQGRSSMNKAELQRELGK
ncbi:plasmid stabilization protein [Streptomyces sp. NPDC045431]|uniref:plasmid stabilization protein n=1 Tax=Streptomyces sp. NPDC045431 TaxID=3155613 RepID=UPI0033EA23D1